MKPRLDRLVVAAVLMLWAPLSASAQDHVISASASARDCEKAYVEALRRLIQRHGAVLIEMLGRDQTRVAGAREQSELAIETETLIGGLFRTRFVRTQPGKSGCVVEITVTQEELARSQEAWLELLETKRGQEVVVRQLAKLQDDMEALQNTLRAQSRTETASPTTYGPGSQVPTPTGRSSGSLKALVHPPRILFVRIDAAFETYSDPFDVTSSFALYGQSGSMKSSYIFEPPQSITGSQVGGTLRIWRHFAIGATRSRTKGSFSSTVNARIPSPQNGFLPRSAEADFVGLHRSQDILHIELTATAGGDDFEASVYAGPSLMKVSQELISGVTVRETFGYATIAGGQTREVENDGTTGFNLGFDATWFFLRYFGFGGGVRYSRGVAEVLFQGRQTEVVLGATHVSVGARLRF